MSLIEQVGQFLVEDEWFPKYIEERSSYKMGYSSENVRYQCYAYVREDLEQILFYAVYPIRIPEDRRVEVMEFITRANYGLRIGNFEMDLDDGDLRYKSSMDCEGVELSPLGIKHCLYPATQTASRYYPALMELLYQGKSAEDAIQSIEHGGGE